MMYSAKRRGSKYYSQLAPRQQISFQSIKTGTGNACDTLFLSNGFGIVGNKHPDDDWHKL